jgi:hypothetical protein
MPQVKIDFVNKSVPEKIAKARLYVSRITGNSNFTTPTPPLETVTTATDELETAYEQAQGGGKTSKQILSEKEAALNKLMSTLAAYVQAATAGNELKILSSGMDVRKERTKQGELPAATGLLATVGTTPGTILCKWDPVKGKASYRIEIATDLTGAEWKFAGNSTQAKFIIEGLESGKKYMIRVIVTGSAGDSPASDPAVGMAG